MDEQQWLQGDSVWPMLEHLLAVGNPSDRKLRLFLCACCRRIWHLLADKRFRIAVEVAERFSEGHAPRRRLRSARAKLSVAGGSDPDRVEFYQAIAVFRATAERLNRRQVADAAAAAASCAGGDVVAWRSEDGCQCRLLRCLFGNPFQTLSPRSFPPHVLGLADAISQAFPAVSEDYAVLADALEELGATDAAAHCRQELHARGCHVLDWIGSIE
jgi:hypothetical protein